MSHIIKGKDPDYIFSESLNHVRKNSYVNGYQNDPISERLPRPRNNRISEKEVIAYYNHFLEYLKRDHHYENPRHQQAKKTLKNIIKPGMYVLDIGCGTGITSKFMGELGAFVVGVDISDKLIEFAQRTSTHYLITYMVADATKLNLQKKFDVITIIDCMEHILPHSLDDYFQGFYRHASEETIIYLNIPDGRYQLYMKSLHP